MGCGITDNEPVDSDSKIGRLYSSCVIVSGPPIVLNVSVKNDLAKD